jgi:hypothetical protein
MILSYFRQLINPNYNFFFAGISDTIRRFLLQVATQQLLEKLNRQHPRLTYISLEHLNLFLDPTSPKLFKSTKLLQNNHITKNLTE